MASHLREILWDVLSSRLCYQVEDCSFIFGATVKTCLKIRWEVNKAWISDKENNTEQQHFGVQFFMQSTWTQI